MRSTERSRRNLGHAGITELVRLDTAKLSVLFVFFFLKKWNKKNKASRQKETTAKHRPKTPDTRDAKT